MERIAVTGVGAVSALATSAEATFERVIAGDRAFGPVSLFDPGATRCRIAAEVKGLELTSIAPRAELARYTRSDALALLAAREALAQAGGESGRLGLVVGATTGGMFETENDLLASPDAPLSVRAARLLSHPLSATAELLSLALPGVVHSTTVCSACSSSAVSLVRAAALLRMGAVDRALAGGTDGLCRLTFIGFDALGALDPEPCRPFDVARRGLTLGEASAFLVLERESVARARGAHILAFLSGGAVSAEAHHITHPEPSGSSSAELFSRALAQAGITPAEVGYVNAHGTGTPQNDAMEARAFHAVFGAEAGNVAVSSTKAQLGHTLGAAGALEAVMSVLALERGLAPATVGLEQPEDVALGHITGKPRVFTRPVAVSCSFGFGGTGSVLVFESAASERRGPVEARAVRSFVTASFCVGEKESADPLSALSPERSRRFDRGAAWAALASTTLLERARLSPSGVAAVLGTAYGSVERSVRFLLRATEAGARMVSPAEFPHLVASGASGNVSIYAGLTGPALTIVDRDGALEESLNTAAALISEGHAHAAIVGTVSPPDPVIEAALASAGGGGDSSIARAEGGAFVLLESAESVALRRATAIAEFVGAWAVQLPVEGPLALPPPKISTRARVLTAAMSDAATAYLDGSAWGDCVRVSVLADGFHESLAAVAVVRALSLIETHGVDEVLIASAPSTTLHGSLFRALERSE
jgi:3-oxoacyl-[acyl-carrier-protein] synthase II